MNNTTQDQNKYNELVEKHGRTVNGEELVYIRRQETASTRLLVSLATLMNKGKFSSLPTHAENFPGDVLFFADPNNSYYLREDGGFTFKSVVAEFMRDYDPKEVVFCGASMAGYASIDLALHFNANAVVNNPQINLDATKETCWGDLRDYIDNINSRHNIDDLTYKNRNTVIGALFGQHPMDVANMEAFVKICTKTPGLGVLFGHTHDKEHKYYYHGISTFMNMVNAVLSYRKFMDTINSKFTSL